MNVLRPISILVLILNFGVATAQLSIEWQRTYGGNYADEAFDIVSNDNGTHYVVGRTASNNGDVFGSHGGFDCFVVKINEDGTANWKRTFGGSSNETPYSVVALDAGGILIVGVTFSNDGDVPDSHGESDAWVLKIGENGSLEWSKTLGGTSFDEFWSVLPTEDGGYLVVGRSGSQNGDVAENFGNLDTWLVKLSSVGEVIWSKVYGGSKEDGASRVINTSDGGYLVIGQTSSTDGNVSSGNGNVDYWVLKVDSLGDLEWEHSYGGSGADVASDGYEITDGYLICGYTGSNNNGDVNNFMGYFDCWLIKIDYSGNLIWEKTYGGSKLDYAYQLSGNSDGTTWIVGDTKSTDGDVTGNSGGGDLWMFKIDNNTGDLLWQQTFGGTKAEVGFAIDRTPDDGFVVAGYTWSTNGDLTGIPNKGYNDFWILKLSPETMSATEEAEAEPILLYPNPAADMVNISVPEPYSELQIMVTDASGIAVLQKEVINGGAVSLAGLPAGIYTFHARMPDGRVRTGKLGKH